MNHLINWSIDWAGVAVICQSIAKNLSKTSSLADAGAFPLRPFLIVSLVACLTYLLGLTQNKRLQKLISPGLQIALVICAFSIPYFPYSLAGTPAIVYWLPTYLSAWPLLLFPLFISAHPATLLGPLLLTYLLSALAMRLAQAARSNDHWRQRYYQDIDRLTKQFRSLKTRNHQLMGRYDLDRRNDILSERNRIARAIHDNVGHRLTGAILQVGALRLTADETYEQQLQDLQNNLTEAMEEIRESVHNLHDDSLNLQQALEKLAHNFHFCPIRLTVDLTHEPSGSIHYALLAICREALANTAKHSQATRVDLTFQETAQFYRLLIVDQVWVPKLQRCLSNEDLPNEAVQDPFRREALEREASPPPTPAGRRAQTKGLGLISIEERVRDLGGTCHISNSNGFRIFIQLPVQQASIRRKIGQADQATAPERIDGMIKNREIDTTKQKREE